MYRVFVRSALRELVDGSFGCGIKPPEQDLAYRKGALQSCGTPYTFAIRWEIGEGPLAPATHHYAATRGNQGYDSDDQSYDTHHATTTGGSFSGGPIRTGRAGRGAGRGAGSTA